MTGASPAGPELAAVRPMRFGILQMSSVPSGRWWRDRARQVEQLGFASLLLSDHFDRSPVAPLPAMAAAAAVTDQLIVGTLVLNNDLRHPALLAKELATIALLSGGRVELGIGAGWMSSDYQQLGRQRLPAAQRIARLDESIGLLRCLLTESAVTHRGEHYQLDDMRPVPAGAGAGIKVLVGGGGRRILTLAGQRADIVSINWNVRAGVMGADALASGTPEAMDEKVGWVRNASVSRDPEIHVQCYLFQITDRPVEAVSSWLDAIGASATDPALALQSPHVLAGTEAAIVTKINELRSRWGVTYVSFYDEAIDQAGQLIGAFRP